MSDEVWTTKDGREIAVADMTEDHVRNALRMLIRKGRKKQHDRRLSLIAKDENLPEQFFECLDNPTILAGLRQRHGNDVRVERSSVAGIGGGNVYVGNRHIGWFGGV